jgi:DNA-binding transcriptional ArsR family regulator
MATDPACGDIETLQTIAPDAIQRMAETFKVLADPTRLQMLVLLMDHELCVHDLTAMFDLTQPAISHHLRVLREMRLVKHRKQGRHVFYTLDDDHVSDLIRHALDHIQHG